MNKSHRKGLAILLLIVLFTAGCKNLSSDLPSNTPTVPVTQTVQPTPTGEPRIDIPSKLEKVTFYSQALEKTMRMNVYLPPGYETNRKYPVLYMLHGYFGTESAWMPQMQMEKTADRLIAAGRMNPIIIVSPELDNSYGLNSAEKYRIETPKDPVHSRYYGKYEDYFVKDVLSYVDTQYSTAASKEKRYVGGFSMGGFVSLSVAFRHTELFSKAGGHSPAIWTDWSRVPRMKSWLYPTKTARQERDPVELAKSKDLSGISVYLDCGDADDYKLYVGTKKLYDILQHRGVPSEYHLNPGTHSRTYWQSKIEDYLLFYDPVER